MKNESKSKAKAPTIKRALKSAKTDENPTAKSKTTEKKASATKAKTAVKGAPVKAAAKTAPKAAKSKAATKAPAAKGHKAKAPAKATAAKIVAEEPGTQSSSAEPRKASARRLKIEELPETGPVLDPIGDTTDGEGRAYTGNVKAPAKKEKPAVKAKAASEAPGEAMEAEEDAAQPWKEYSGEEERAPREPVKLERLQKILSQAGIASRRHAEEMITGGQVMVNGKVVTELGTKADAAHDHIRVGGKLLQGAERRRYYMLNKPKGYVTTVSDPEGRPTVMEFFAKTKERLYPVGRLDFLSEGLLLMTNDGELANLLTKAGSGVEKIYLVKVAGQPTEAELDRLRAGVEIERGEIGSARVRTSPARVQQVREGDNPWYEVVLIEGRNRELRKMFSAVGHFVEKIRRVGYGPLVLDLEPGKFRELDAEEVKALRLTAEGKMKPRRPKVERIPPHAAARSGDRGGNKRFDRPAGRGGKPAFGAKRSYGEGRPSSGGRPSFGGARPERSGFDRPRFDKPRFDKPAGAPESGAAGGVGERPKFEGRKPFTGGQRPFTGGRPSGGGRPSFDRPRFDKPRSDRPGGEKRRFDKPRFEKRSFDKPKFDKPRFDRPRPSGPRFDQPAGAPDAGAAGGFAERPKFEGRKPFTGSKRPFTGASPSQGGRPSFDRPRSDRPRFDKPRFDKPRFDKPRTDRPGSERSGTDKPRFEKRSFDGPRPGGPGFDKPRFDKPRADRPRPDRPQFDRPAYGSATRGPSEGRQGEGAQRSFRPRPDGAQSGRPSFRPGGAGRPKTGFGGKPGGFSRPSRPGGFGGPKPGGGGRGGPKFGGKRP